MCTSCSVIGVVSYSNASSLTCTFQFIQLFSSAHISVKPLPLPTLAVTADAARKVPVVQTVLSLCVWVHVLLLTVSHTERHFFIHPAKCYWRLCVFFPGILVHLDAHGGRGHFILRTSINIMITMALNCAQCLAIVWTWHSGFIIEKALSTANKVLGSCDYAVTNHSLSIHTHKHKPSINRPGLWLQGGILCSGKHNISPPTSS